MGRSAHRATQAPHCPHEQSLGYHEARPGQTLSMQPHVGERVGGGRSPPDPGGRWTVGLVFEGELSFRRSGLWTFVGLGERTPSDAPIQASAPCFSAGSGQLCPSTLLWHNFDDFFFLLPCSFLGWCQVTNVAVGGRKNRWAWVVLRGGVCGRQGREGRGSRGGRRMVSVYKVLGNPVL